MVNNLLSPLGLEAVRKERAMRPTLTGVLEQVRQQGVNPGSVIDVGAAYGDWSTDCYKVFPDATYLLVEPLEEFADFLKERTSDFKRAAFIPAAATSKGGKLTLHVHKDLVGSSLFREAETGVNEKERTVRGITVDEIVQEQKAPGPFLLKVDAQGAELNVLAGATETLRHTDIVILEVSFFQFFVNGPQFHEVVNFMKGFGFVVYDLFDLAYRPLDGALSQGNAVFVPENSPLRSRHEYAEPGQRQRQDAMLQSVYSRRRK
jgi:FkbM family methyltransferase